VPDTYTLNAQVVEDLDARDKRPFPSEGYLVTADKEVQLQDSISLDAAEERSLWTKLAGDGIADDWKLLYVEALDLQAYVELTLLDNVDVLFATYRIPIVPGVPLCLGSRAFPTTTPSYVSEVKVNANNGATRIRYAFVR
jgi:hypothetical protein